MAEKVAVLHRGRAETRPSGNPGIAPSIFRRERCCGGRAVRISHATAVVNGVGGALSKRLEREKARMN